MRLGITKLQRRIADLEAFDPKTITKRWSSGVKTLETAIEESLATVFGHNTVEYNRYKDAAELDNGPVVMRVSPAFGGPRHYDDSAEAQQYVAEGIAASVQLLKQAIRGLEEEIADRAPLEAETQTTVPPASAGPLPRKIFVVHGQDDARETVARFLERLGFEAIILQEKASGGRTVIEKVEAYADVGYAVVIMTPDDVGCLKGSTPQPRARQNVVLELGYFIGRLGRKHVCALKRGELEIPSDINGLVYIPFDNGEAWKIGLGRELKEAGFDIDWNKVHG